MLARSALRTARHSSRNVSLIRQPAVRYASFTTPPAKKPRSFRNTAARWGLALGGIYFYATSDWLRNEPSYATAGLAPAGTVPPQPTLEELAEARRQRRVAAAAGQSPQTLDSASASAPLPSTSSSPPPAAAVAHQTSPTDPGNPQDLESEAGSQGAFNEETGEIDWFCPCLGGMAQGPCGEEFKTAFSCFVYSEAEPKGVDCIEKFKGMQDCFRLHPDVYGSELEDVADEEAVESVREPEKQDKTASDDLPGGLKFSSQAGEQSNLPGANVTSTPSASPTSLSGSTGIPADAPSKQAADQKSKGERISRAKGAKDQTSKLSTDVEGEVAVPSAYHNEKRGRKTEK